MKLRSFILSMFMVLVMAGASLADELQAPDDAQDSSEVQDSVKVQQKSGNSSFQGVFPWNVYIGAAALGSGAGFSFGADWVFGLVNVLYESAYDDPHWLPNHLLVWTIGTHAFFANGFNFLLQPNIQYQHSKLFVFKFSVGPEIGYINETGFDFGFSACLGVLLDLANVRIGYLVRTENVYVQASFNLPMGVISSI